jgi:hypothetical protein
LPILRGSLTLAPQDDVSFVMAGLVPAIYVFGRPRAKDVDARVKPAHDGRTEAAIAVLDHD